MKDLVIVGVGGVGRALRFFVDDVNRIGAKWNLVGFLDEDSDSHGRTVHGLPVLGPLEWLADRPETRVLLGIGDPQGRDSILRKITSISSHAPATLIHPRAYVGENAEVGPGSVIYPGACVDPDTILGEGVLINQNATVGHDSVLGRLATLAPLVALGGAVNLGEGCNLGIGSSVIQGVRIGDWAIVGAGAAVISDLPDSVTAVGVPARAIEDRR